MLSTGQGMSKAIKYGYNQAMNTVFEVVALNAKFQIFHPNMAKATRYIAIAALATGIIAFLAAVFLKSGLVPHTAMFLTQAGLQNTFYFSPWIAAAGGFYLLIDSQGKQLAQMTLNLNQQLPPQ